MTVIAVATTVAIGTGGLAIASDASPNKSIHGCVNKASGGLRVASHCSARERSLTWNQRGPAGRRGARGAVGPARAWTEFPVPPNTVVTLSATAKQLESSPPLPGGSYVASAAVTVFSTGAVPTVRCTLTMGAGGGNTDVDLLRLQHNQVVPDSLSISGTIATGTRVTLACSSVQAAAAIDSQITIIQVRSLQQN